MIIKFRRIEDFPHRLFRVFMSSERSLGDKGISCTGSWTPLERDRVGHLHVYPLRCPTDPDHYQCLLKEEGQT